MKWSCERHGSPYLPCAGILDNERRIDFDARHAKMQNSLQEDRRAITQQHNVSFAMATYSQLRRNHKLRYDPALFVVHGDDERTIENLAQQNKTIRTTFADLEQLRTRCHQLGITFDEYAPHDGASHPGELLTAAQQRCEENANAYRKRKHRFDYLKKAEQQHREYLRKHGVTTTAPHASDDETLSQREERVEALHGLVRQTRAEIKHKDKSHDTAAS
mmetsp:Transcript_17887/g.54705  ORF Transcript_17887/g.54705 Transcript_17887/m.54705 type:complete len:218 (-) Transcript_17887:785-1438(-)